jgi:probable HAF family extracellular repeat protein
MPFPRLLAAAILGACSLGSQAATYQLTYVSTADAGWNYIDLNRHGAVTGRTYVGQSGESRAHIFENGQTRLLKAVGEYNGGAAINDRGDVAGQCQKHDHHRSCLWKASGAVEVIVNTLGGPKGFLEVKDVNSARQVVGYARTADHRIRPFLYENGTTRDLGSLGRFSSEATGINKQGHVSGYATLPDGSFRAFIHDGTELKVLGVLGTDTFADALNDNDVAVGRADLDEDTRHAVMFKNGQVIDLGTLGGPSEATGINNHEVVVGRSRPEEGPSVAFVYRNGRMIDLNTELDPVSGAGWHLLSGHRINDKGQIVAIAERAGDWESHVVLLTPVE